MKVPFLELKSSYRDQQAELDASYRRVMESGQFVLGEEVKAFEKEFAEYCGVKHCVGVGNGLEALHLTVRACGIGPGDEVIVPSNTYIASWLAVSHAGARPVPVEPVAGTYNIDPGLIERAVTNKTKAVMAVHLYGQTADMKSINQVAHQLGLVVIEDAAQAHGALCNGKRAGALGDAAGFSFYPSKNLGAIGDAGAVTTNSADIADSVRINRNYGSKVRYENETRGFNSRLDELQAAFLRTKLKRLDAVNARRREVARAYLSALDDVPGISLPQVPAWAEPVWHLFVLRHMHRDGLREHLERAGIGTQIHYPIPPHLSKAYQDSGFRQGQFPVAEDLARTILSIPSGPALSSSEIDYVIAQLRAFKH